MVGLVSRDDEWPKVDTIELIISITAVVERHWKSIWAAGPWPIHLSTKPLIRFRWTFFSVDGRGLSGVSLLLFVYVIYRKHDFISYCLFFSLCIRNRRIFCMSGLCSMRVGQWTVGWNFDRFFFDNRVDLWRYSPRYYWHDLRIPCSSEHALRSGSSELAQRQYTRMVHWGSINNYSRWVWFFVTHYVI